MVVEFLPSQIGTEDGVPLPYTSSPLLLLLSDVLLFFRSLWCFPGIIFPLKPWGSGELDELYPSRENLTALGIHAFLCVYQIAFLVSLPFCYEVPLVWVVAYVVVVLVVNHAICKKLNGNRRFLQSRVPVVSRPEHESEHWIFVNGVAVGEHWLQNNIDRLSYTFGRKITGVHNPTAGIIFDTIQCLIERNFCYATDDVRDAYELIKGALSNPKNEKVVLILHSQGGIQGGLVIDWLLAEIPQDLLQKLEVYTFGNAANHFNNPHRYVEGLQNAKATRGATHSDGKSIRYIEHYANSYDFVSVWGVLNFIRISNRYMGRVFVRPGWGHQLNQHYLDTMFPLGPDRKVLEKSEFMEMEVQLPKSGVTGGDEGEGLVPSIDNDDTSDEEEATVFDANTPVDVTAPVRKRLNGSLPRTLKVKHFSRLWLYRNGRSPATSGSFEVRPEWMSIQT